MEPFRTFEGLVKEVSPSHLHSGMDLVSVVERGRTLNDDNLVSLHVPSGTVSVGDTVSLNVDDGVVSLIDH